MKIKILFTIAISLLFIKCKKQEFIKVNKIPTKEKIQPDDIKSITQQEAQTFYKNPEKKYEYRTGKFNEYEYNYNVKGFDEKNNQVSGSIITQGEFGAGILSSLNNKKIEVEVKWISHGRLIAKDSLNNKYELEVKE